MNLHKLTLYCVDFENTGLEDIKTILENSKYIHVFRILGKTADIGEWEDEHPLNYNDTPLKEFEKYFKNKEAPRHE